MLITTTETVETAEPVRHESVQTLRSSRSARLSAAEEAECARAWRLSGCCASRERLVTGNLGLVVAIAQRYRGGGVPLDELIAEGNLGLVHAVDGFNPDCGSRFSTYAAYWIRQGISRAFAASSPRGRLSGHQRRDLSMYERGLHRFYTLMGSTPNDAEMAEMLEWVPGRISACRERLGAYSRPTSLEQPRTVGAVRTTEPDRKAEVPSITDPETHKRVVRLLSKLTAHERTIVEMRFGLHGGQSMTIGAIGRSMGRSKREVGGVLHGAMASLSRTVRSNGMGLDTEAGSTMEARTFAGVSLANRGRGGGA